MTIYTNPRRSSHAEDLCVCLLSFELSCSRVNRLPSFKINLELIRLSQDHVLYPFRSTSLYITSRQRRLWLFPKRNKNLQCPPNSGIYQARILFAHIRCTAYPRPHPQRYRHASTEKRNATGWFRPWIVESAWSSARRGRCAPCCSHGGISVLNQGTLIRPSRVC